MVTHRLRINRHLEALVGERHPESSPRALQKAAHYLTTQFAKSGWTTSGQLVSAWDKIYRNVVAIKYLDKPGRGGELPPLLIGAHYDTVSGSPGADDNASGLVVLLEVASRLRARSLARPIWLVAFCLEEQDRLGSQAFVSRLKAERRELAGAIILECVGYARSEAGTQQSPPGVPIAVPTQGDFLAIVGNETSRSLVRQLEQEARQHAAKLKTTRPAKLPRIDFADNLTTTHIGAAAQRRQSRAVDYLSGDSSIPRSVFGGLRRRAATANTSVVRTFASAIASEIM